jgi:hypothetical protein
MNSTTSISGLRAQRPSQSIVASVPGQKFCTILVKIRKSLWGQGFRLAAGLLPGAGMVQDF